MCIGVREIFCQGGGGGGGGKPFAKQNSRKLPKFLRNVQSTRYEGHTMQQQAVLTYEGGSIP